MIRTSLLLLPLLAAACAGPLGAPGPQYVEEFGDAKALASGSVGLVTAHLRRGTMVHVGKARPETLAPALANELRHAGFAETERSGSHAVRYAVFPLPDGVIVRIAIDDEASGARFFARNPNGALQAAGPL